MTCFTGENFTTEQERFAPWCLAPQAGRDASGGELIAAFGDRGRTTRRVAPLARYPISRRAALLTGRSLTAMKQLTINDRWYYMTAWTVRPAGISVREIGIGQKEYHGPTIGPRA